MEELVYIYKKLPYIYFKDIQESRLYRLNKRWCKVYINNDKCIYYYNWKGLYNLQTVGLFNLCYKQPVFHILFQRVESNGKA